MTANTKVAYTGDGTTKIFAIPFDYIEQPNVHVFVNGTEIDQDTLIFPSGSEVQLPIIPANGSSVVVQRITPRDSLPATVQTGTISPVDLNDNYRNLLYITQELNDLAADAVATAAAIEADVAICQTAAASVAAISEDLTLIQSYGLHKGANNFLDIVTNPTFLNAILTNTFVGYLDAEFATAAASGQTWVFPSGTYHASNKITMAPGTRFIGMGESTIIYLGGDGSWGMEQLNPIGNTAIKAFELADIHFYITNGGIRWNSATGGFSDDDSTQDYMARPRAERLLIDNDSVTHYTALGLYKCFNGIVHDCTINNPLIGIHLIGSDINAIRDNRIDFATDGCVLDLSSGTFGSSTVIEHNDFNNPKNYYVRTTNRDLKILYNHMETDVSPGSTGTAGNMEAAIDILGTGNCFMVEISGNRMETSLFCDRMIRFRAQSTCYSLIVKNNLRADQAHSEIIDIGRMPYFTNAGNRVVCIHEGNGGEDLYFPMNTRNEDSVLGSNLAVLLNASRPGVSFGGSTLPAPGPECFFGDFIFSPDSNTGHYIEFSDWEGQPANQMIGHFNIAAVLYANAASQEMRYDVLDNGTSLISGWQTYTASAANKKELVTLATGVTAATKLQIRFQNIDTTHGAVASIQQIIVALA